MNDFFMWVFIILSIIQLFMISLMIVEGVRLHKEKEKVEAETKRLNGLIDEAKVVHEDVMNSAAKLTPISLAEYLESLKGSEEPKMKVVNHTYLTSDDNYAETVGIAYRSRDSEIRETVHFHKEIDTLISCAGQGCKTYYRGKLVELESGPNN